MNERVVADRNRITGGGVTAGIDFGLTIAALLHGALIAKEIQLMMEYNPDPPFDFGSPESAGPEIAERVRASRRTIQEERRRAIERIVHRRDEAGSA